MVEEGKFDPESYFGGIDIFHFDQAFAFHFDDAALMRKSSFGLHGASIDQYQSNPYQQDEEAKYHTGDFTQSQIQRAESREKGDGFVMRNFEGSLCSSDEDDEAAKFVQQTINNLNRDPHIKQSQPNLMLKEDMVICEDHEEEDFNRRTPRIINSDDDVASTKNKPKFNFSNCENLQDLIVEESREESFVADPYDKDGKKILLQHNFQSPQDML
mmetsp:Transcript_1945/g.1852  ORF Transcript_1945/g.1852 Transcript_1945/m.1852 type:complete len:214 (-) Transcript_1945:2235-2876(-)